MERSYDQSANRIPSFFPALKTINPPNTQALKNADNEAATKPAALPGRTVVWTQKTKRKKTKENPKPVYSDVVIRKNQPVSSYKAREICFMKSTRAGEDDVSYNRRHSHPVTQRQTKDEERVSAGHFQGKKSYAKDLRKKSSKVVQDDNSQSIKVSSKTHSNDNSKDTSDNPERSAESLKTRNIINSKRNFKFGKDISYEDKISSGERFKDSVSIKHLKSKADSKETVINNREVSHEEITLNLTEEKTGKNKKPNTYHAKFNAKIGGYSRNRKDNKSNADANSNDTKANANETHTFLDNAAAAIQYAENAAQKNSVSTDGVSLKRNLITKNASENDGKFEVAGCEPTRLVGSTSLLDLDAISQQHSGCCAECFRARAKSADHIRNMSWKEQETSPLDSLNRMASNDEDLEKSLTFIRDAMTALEVIHKLAQNVGSTKHYLRNLYDVLGSSSEVARYRRTISDGGRVDERNDTGKGNNDSTKGQDERGVARQMSTCKTNETELLASSRPADGSHDPRESSIKSDGRSGNGTRRDRDKNLLELSEEWKKRNFERKSYKEQNRK